MRVRILYHDHCFDGAASAAFFSRFIAAKYCRNEPAEFLYTGMAHKASQLFEDSLFDGDINAIVDFKYSPHPALTCGSITTKARSFPPKTRNITGATRRAASSLTPPTGHARNSSRTSARTVWISRRPI
jgi:hypothetical protein